MRLFWGVLLSGMVLVADAQVYFSANDTVPPYRGDFGFGANIGAYPPWRDENLANIAAGNSELGIEGLGITTFRPELPELFVEYWGYDIRVETFRHYTALGMKDHVLFIGRPSPAHRDSSFYCPDQMSQLFKNLYLPIWDDGADGTPINDSNFFARYVYLLAVHYGNEVRFWEIWNEPDLDLSGNAILTRGQPGNWWENNPQPCETPLFAPFYQYIRMLRIAYEVIKSVHPEDYVAVGGLGNMSYLDAILRNTDNPVDGSVDQDYPLKGGAYFDCLSFHSYPHLDGSLRYWDNNINGFAFTRHSDKAVDGMLSRRDAMEAVLFEHGYDGRTYPEKEWILTETNIPRKAFAPEYLGTDHAQRNFLIKAAIACQMHGIRQFHPYSLADVKTEEVADYEFELMGFVKNLDGTDPHDIELNDAGIAYRTCSRMLKGWQFDPVETIQMNLPEPIEGAAFRKNDSLQYVLWGRTETDNSEFAFQQYSFPPGLQIERLERFRWDYSAHLWSDFIDPEGISLNGDPVFLKPVVLSRVKAHLTDDYLNLCVAPNPTTGAIQLNFSLAQPDYLSASLIDLTGRNISKIFENQHFTGSAHQMDFYLPDDRKGIYFVKIEGNSQVVVQKIVVR